LKSAEVATFAIMFRILGIFLFVALTTFVWGQTSGNPFDLKYRTSRPINTTPAVIKQAPIDSLRKAQTPDALPDTIKRDMVQPAPDTTSVAPGNSETNPFEVKQGPDTTSHKTVSTADTSKNNHASGKIIPPALRKNSSKGFQIFFLLVSLLFLIFIVNVERSFVRDLWRVISNENYSSLHHRNQRNTMRQILLIMGYTIFIIQAGMFIYHGFRIFRPYDSSLDNVWITIALVLGIYLTRHGMIRYLRWLFNNDKELTLFGFDISIFNTMVGLVLLPINILIVFGPDSMHKPLIFIGIATIAAAYLLRQLRWMLTARQLIANSLFLFFVYLCAVEILPLWAISKIFW
jgi:hypothetical protein